MSKLICLDPGHGYNTVGKRSPDGSLREYEFNGAVALLTKKYLEQNGFKVLLTRPCTAKDTDVSLQKRCDIANKAKADLFISIHANAFGSGWSDAHGYENYIWKTGGQAEKVAKIIAKYAKDLGVILRSPTTKAANFYVLRKTDMPAVLIEHAFYTNKEECALLKTAAFRDKCAVHIAKGVCDYYGVTWKEEIKPAPLPTPVPEPAPEAKPPSNEPVIIPYGGVMSDQPGALWYGDGYQGEGLYFRKKYGKWVKIA